MSEQTLFTVRGEGLQHNATYHIDVSSTWLAIEILVANESLVVAQ